MPHLVPEFPLLQAFIVSYAKFVFSILVEFQRKSERLVAEAGTHLLPIRLITLIATEWPAPPLSQKCFLIVSFK